MIQFTASIDSLDKSKISTMQSRTNSLVFFILASVSVLPWISCFPSSSHPKDNTNKNFKISSNPTLPTVTEEPESSEEDVLDNSSADYSVEQKCSEEEFWHIRGKSCVPFKCPRANWMRDENTGKGLHRQRDIAPLKSVARIRNRNGPVMRPQRTYSARGMYTGTRWTSTSGRQRIRVDDTIDMDRLVRTGIVG